MTNLHESYLAGHGFDITTPRLKTDDRSAALPTVLPGPVNCVYVCMYVCVLKCGRARTCVCVCRRRMDGRTEDGEMGGFKCVHVCASDLSCVRVTICTRME